MDGVRKKRKLKFKRNIKKVQTQQNNFDEWFNELEFENYNAQPENEVEQNENVLEQTSLEYQNENYQNSLKEQIESSTFFSNEDIKENQGTFDSEMNDDQSLELNSDEQKSFNELNKKDLVFRNSDSFIQSNENNGDFNLGVDSGSLHKINQGVSSLKEIGTHNLEELIESENASENNSSEVNESFTQVGKETFEIKQDELEKNIDNNLFNLEAQNNFVDDRINNFFRESDDDNFRYSKLSFSGTRKKLDFSLRDLFESAQPTILMPKSIYTVFAVFIGIFVLGFGLFSFVGNTFAVKENVMGAGDRAVDSVKTAVEYVGNKDFQSSENAMNEAYDEMVFASEEMNSVNSMAVFISEFIPGASQLSSGKHIVETGKYLTHVGKEANLLAYVVNDLVDSKNELSINDVSFLKIYQDSMVHVAAIDQDVKKANENMAEVNLDDVPEEYRSKFSDMKNILPHIEESLDVAVEGQDAIEDILGANGPRKYLFLFQNNHEMRATGGFIGSYGLLEISNGKITNFKVDGIFNPGGQLIDRVVPPLPVQKISADWSLHDSNWFPNFPTSAEKAIDFYERTGGPTVDGVVTITPTVMRKILDVTGSIRLDEYDIEVNSENFMEVIQTEVEENYDKEENKPKKILADLTPLVFEKVISTKNPKDLVGVVNVISKSLDEKHILIYMRNEYIQDVISESGWSGEIIETDKDYLSVINSNINGFKTDGVVEESIKHSAEIYEDGSVINTVTITRSHKGGHTGFEWWDSVNSDYMRIYVPEGSRLLSVEGQTREINEDRLDYDILGYERDKDIVSEEENRVTDEKSGTRIYEESGKTVFANWVYVSPQETATITYKYILPFKIDFNQDKTGQFGSYAAIYQKQSGSEKSTLESEIVLPNGFELFWESDDENDLKMRNELNTDLYHGAVFQIK